MNNYQNGIDILKEFTNKIYQINNKENVFFNEDEFLFYISNFYEILFYLSKSYLNDNFANLINQIDETIVKQVFTGKITKDNFSDNCFINDNDEIIEDLIKNQFFQIPNSMLEDIPKTFRLIRNYLAHFNYIIIHNKIIINLKESDLKKYNVNTISFSVESLVMLILSTLSNQGQSYCIDAYDYLPFIAYSKSSKKINIENSVILKYSNISDYNIKTPFEIAKYIQSCRFHQLEIVIDTINKNGNYNITKLNLDETIIQKLNPNLLNIDKSRDFINLYMACFDDIRRATLAYKFSIDILYLIVKGQEEKIYPIYENYLPIINNTLFICYMSLVFDDYSVNKNGIISETLFEELYLYNNNENISRKFRNSLAHARYKFEDILDDSKGIIIEFWDEHDSIINFQCKISKENALLLIDKYLK